MRERCAQNGVQKVIEIVEYVDIGTIIVDINKSEL